MKQRIKITINSDHQIYDILNKTYLIGRSREGMANYSPELISSIKASEDDEDLNQIKRSCMDAVSMLKQYIAEYLEEDRTSADNILNWGTTTFTLLMPSNYNTSATDAIAQLCHKYISNKVCYEWFVIANPTDAAPYNAECDKAIVALRQAVSKRKRPVPPSGFMDYPEYDEPIEE